MRVPWAEQWDSLKVGGSAGTTRLDWQSHHFPSSFCDQLSPTWGHAEYPFAFPYQPRLQTASGVMAHWQPEAAHHSPTAETPPPPCSLLSTTVSQTPLSVKALVHKGLNQEQWRVTEKEFRWHTEKHCYILISHQKNSKPKMCFQILFNDVRFSLQINLLS